MKNKLRSIGLLAAGLILGGVLVPIVVDAQTEEREIRNGPANPVAIVGNLPVPVEIGNSDPVPVQLDNTEPLAVDVLSIDPTTANAFEVVRLFCNGVAGCDDGNGNRTTREFDHPMLVSSMTIFIDIDNADGIITLRGPSDDEFSGPVVWQMEPYFAEPDALNGLYTVTFPNPIPVASADVLCLDRDSNPGCAAMLSLSGTR